MKQVKLGTIGNGGVFHFIDDPESRTFRVIANRKDNIVFYNAISRPDDDFELTLANGHPDWLTHDVDVFIED
jgi:hypothetical protein